MPRAWQLCFGLVLGCLGSWPAEGLESWRAERLRPELLRIEGPRSLGLGFLPVPWLPSTLAPKPLSSVTTPLLPVGSPHALQPFRPLAPEPLSVKHRSENSRGGRSEGSRGDESEDSEGLGAKDWGAEEVKAEELKAKELKAEELKAEDMKSGELKADELKADELKAEGMKADELTDEDMKAPEPIAQAREELRRMYEELGDMEVLLQRTRQRREEFDVLSERRSVPHQTLNPSSQSRIPNPESQHRTNPEP